MRIAVVGGGLFGCTAAIALAEQGHEVHLYEKNKGLFTAASGINQYRLHKGYHYPRSSRTARECQAGLASFKRVYGQAVVGGVERYYAIAAKDSRTSPKKYLQFLEEHDLPYKVEPPICRGIELLIRVEEERVDPEVLRNIAMIRMAKAGVECHFSTEAGAFMRSAFDQIVVAGYSSNNQICKTIGAPMRKYQYEVCEKPVIALNRISENFRNFSIVVMDGGFCSLDPFGHSGWHVLGHVDHAIHSRNVGTKPEVTFRLEGYLNGGIIAKPIGSKWKQMKKHSSKYIPFLDEALYQGSMFTVRAVLPRKDKTDERPTLVERLDDQVIRIFSGKLGTAVQASHTMLSLLESNPCKTGPWAAQEASPTSPEQKTCKPQSASQQKRVRREIEEQAAEVRRRGEG